MTKQYVESRPTAAIGAVGATATTAPQPSHVSTETIDRLLCTGVGDK